MNLVSMHNDLKLSFTILPPLTETLIHPLSKHKRLINPGIAYVILPFINFISYLA